MQAGIDIYTNIVQIALPIGLAFAIGDFIVVTFLKMALRGRVEI